MCGGDLMPEPLDEVVEMLIELEPGQRHGGGREGGDLVVEDVSVGLSVQSVQIFVRDLMMQPGQQVVGTVPIARQRTPQLVHLV